MCLQADFSRSSPDHHQAVTFVLTFELSNIGNKLLGKVHFVLAGLDIVTLQTLYISLIENSLHRLDLLERRFDPCQQVTFKHTGVGRCLICRIRENIPSAKNQIFQPGQLNEVFYHRYAVICALAEANRSHLCQTSDRLGNAGLDSFNTGDKCRAYRSQAYEQHAQFSLCRRDFCASCYRHFLMTSDTIASEQLNERT